MSVVSEYDFLKKRTKISFASGQSLTNTLIYIVYTDWFISKYMWTSAFLQVQTNAFSIEKNYLPLKSSSSLSYFPLRLFTILSQSCTPMSVQTNKVVLHPTLTQIYKTEYMPNIGFIHIDNVQHVFELNFEHALPRLLICFSRR